MQVRFPFLPQRIRNIKDEELDLKKGEDPKVRNSRSNPKYFNWKFLKEHKRQPSAAFVHLIFPI